METLPALVVEQICSHLTARDLLACSLVSVGWRATVNCDYVWKNVCLKTSNKNTVDHVLHENSVVSPTFQQPEATCTTLEPVCNWRTVYMKLQHLNRNWRKANHQTHKVTEMAYNFFDIKIDGNTLVANVNDNQCEVWCIKGVPRKRETIVCALKDATCKCFINLHEDRLVIVQDTLLQVYKRTNKRYSLCFRRLFDLAERFSTDIPGSLNIDDWYKEKRKGQLTSLHAHLVGRYFIGLVQIGSCREFSFHIWDTITGSKLKEQPVKFMSPDFKDSVYSVKFCSPRSYSGKILVCVQYTQRAILRMTHLVNNAFFTVVYLYDLLSLTFKVLQVFTPHVPWTFYEDQLFLTINHTQAKLGVFSSLNGDFIVSKCYEEIINPDSVQVSGDYLGLTSGGDLVILNIKQDFDLVFTTGILKFSSNLFGFDFVFLSWDLVLIACWDKENKIEVWNFQEKSLLSTLKTSGLICPSNNFVKFFVWNEMVTTIYMLNFW